MHFEIGDVWHPEPAAILQALHGKDLLQGKVIDVSDSGLVPGGFMVVVVEGLSQSVVVPVGRIKGVL